VLLWVLVEHRVTQSVEKMWRFALAQTDARQEIANDTKACPE
jgi:hypothetical protein|tara:strand:- start:12079 stop:12204 length:126 start_codon:yes stop_codon:yes gene_type:complete